MSVRLSPRITAVVCAVFAACSPASGQGIGDTLRNLLLYGGTTVPPAAPGADDAAYCPTVGVIEGAAAVRVFSGGGKTGEPSALRHQISIGQLARECATQPDGSIVVKVGLEGRALVGPAGTAGRFDTPVTFVIKKGSRVLASRTQRVSVAVPPGEARASFIAVEERLVVPPDIGQYEIDVGLGVSGAAPRPAQRSRRG
jgi:hypothetical protein